MNPLPTPEQERALMEQRVRERRKADRFGRWFERGLLALILALYVIGFANARSTDRRLEAQALSIQESRRESIFVSCRETNRRNATAYEFLRSLPPNPTQPTRSPKERERLLRGFTDALVGPVRACRKRAEELTR